MKWVIFILITNLGFSAYEREAGIERAELGQEKVENQKQINEKALEGLVQQIYQACSSQTDEAAFDKCVEEKKQTDFAEEIKQIQQGDEAAVGMLNEKSTKISKEGEKDLALGDYLSDRTDKMLRGIEGEGCAKKRREGTKDSACEKETKIMSDHSHFYDLYKSQLTKNVSLFVNSYCLFASDEFILYKNKKERDKNQKRNTQKLALAANTIQSKTNDSNQAAQHFGSCAGRLNYICQIDDKKDLKEEFKKAIASTEDLPSNARDEDISHSKQQACIVIQQLRKLSGSISATEKRADLADCKGEFDNKKCRERNSTGISKGLIALDFYNPNNDGERFDDITSLSSAEYSEEIEKKLESRFNEKCQGGFETTDCQDFISSVQEMTSDEDQKKIKAQHQIQTEAVARKIASLESNEEIKEMLKAQGKTDEQITKIEEELNGELTLLKAKIEEKYKKEREAHLKEIEQRFASAKDKELSSNPNNRDARMSEVKDNVTGKDLKDLLFFNNIVMGYLNTVNPNDPDAPQSSNISSAQRELASIEERGLQGDYEGIDGVQTQVDAIAGGRDPAQTGGDEGSAVFESQTIEKQIIKDVEDTAKGQQQE